jgi:hypothetical protein
MRDEGCSGTKQLRHRGLPISGHLDESIQRRILCSSLWYSADFVQELMLCAWWGSFLLKASAKAAIADVMVAWDGATGVRCGGGAARLGESVGGQHATAPQPLSFDVKHSPVNTKAS